MEEIEPTIPASELPQNLCIRPRSYWNWHWCRVRVKIIRSKLELKFEFLENPFTGIRAHADGLTVQMGASKGYKGSQKL
jgi:hypothetical protein